jgi:superfamily II DNA or RNA helicase
MIKEKKIFNFQIDAVNASIDFLKNNSEFNLQSPTGSGKTYIIANIIDRYLENEILNNKPTTFLFIAPSIGKLDHQGYEKITNYLNSQ